MLVGLRRVSLEYLLPVGGDDLQRTIGALSLRFARGDEDYVALGEQTAAPPEAGEVIYADEATVLCRRWCWRQGERSKVTPDTRDAVLNVHGLPPAHRSTVESACNALAVAVPSLLGGVAASYVLDDAQPTHVTDLRGLRLPGARLEA